MDDDDVDSGHTPAMMMMQETMHTNVVCYYHLLDLYHQDMLKQGLFFSREMLADQESFMMLNRPTSSQSIIISLVLWYRYTLCSLLPLTHFPLSLQIHRRLLWYSARLGVKSTGGLR